ncbi:MAG: hypothetical protein NPIRA03_41510 [Nitrospirales bacterium]|nr:MAG: hypothetical protein NPIRA03_41510 [Nitrospirales bacterium]
MSQSPTSPDSPIGSTPEDIPHWIEHVFEMWIFASRWIQAPLYGGLILAEVLYSMHGNF